MESLKFEGDLDSELLIPPPAYDSLRADRGFDCGGVQTVRFPAQRIGDDIEPPSWAASGPDMGDKEVDPRDCNMDSGTALGLPEKKKKRPFYRRRVFVKAVLLGTLVALVILALCIPAIIGQCMLQDSSTDDSG